MPGPHDKLTVMPPPALTAEELAVIDAYIRHKRAEARAKAAAKDLSRTVLAILEKRKGVDRKGAWLCLKRRYDYHYSETVQTLQETLELACAREREEGTAKASVTVAVAFEDVAAKALKKGKAAGGAAARNTEATA